MTTTPEKEQLLTKIFSEVGKEYGYNDVTASFLPFADNKIRWQRTYEWVKFEVSDYFLNAPPAALRELAETIFARMTGDSDAQYGPKLNSYLSSDALIAQRPTYIQRQDYKDDDGTLKDAYDSLVKEGLIKPMDDDFKLYYGYNADRYNNEQKYVRTSQLFKTISVDPRLRKDEESRKLAVFKGVTMSEYPPTTTGEDRDAKLADLAKKIEQYPGGARKEKFIMETYGLSNSKPIEWLFTKRKKN